MWICSALLLLGHIAALLSLLLELQRSGAKWASHRIFKGVSVGSVLEFTLRLGRADGTGILYQNGLSFQRDVFWFFLLISWQRYGRTCTPITVFGHRTGVDRGSERYQQRFGMPVTPAFTWTEDETTITFVVRIPGVKTKLCDVAICSTYVKINHPPYIWEYDLVEEIDVDSTKTYSRISLDRVTVCLKKRVDRLWRDPRYVGQNKEDVHRRRKKAVDEFLAREKQVQEHRKQRKHDLLKKGEEEQWRLDREAREKIDRWQAQEKSIAEDEVFEVLDSLETTDPCSTDGGISSEISTLFLNVHKWNRQQ